MNSKEGIPVLSEEVPGDPRHRKAALTGYAIAWRDGFFLAQIVSWGLPRVASVV